MWQTDRRSRSLGGARRRPPVLCPRLPCTPRRGGDEPRYRTARRVRSATCAEPDRPGVDRRRPPERWDRTAMSVHRAPLQRRLVRAPEGAWRAPTALGGIGAKATVPATFGDARGAQTLVAGVADARSAGHRARAKVGHRLPARVAAHGAEVVLQLVDPKSRPDLPGFRRLVRRHRVSVRALVQAWGPPGAARRCHEYAVSRLLACRSCNAGCRRARC